MAGKISIECPACLAKLNISDPSKLGKKLKCPKCQEVFTPEAASDEDDLMDDFDDEEVESKPKLAPLQRGRGGAKPGKGSQKKASSRNSSEGNSTGLLIGAGVVAGIVLLGGIGLLASGIFSGPQPINSNPAPAESVAAAPANPAPASTPAASNAGSTASTVPVATKPASGTSAKPSGISAPATEAEKILGLRWMPADTDLYLHAKVSDIWNTPLIKQILEMTGAAKMLNDNPMANGMPPSEIETISLGIIDLYGSSIRTAAKAKQAGPQFAALSPFATNPFSNDVRFVIVMKSGKKMVLENEIKNLPGAKLQTANGKSYFTVPESKGLPPDTGGWLPDANTFIYATNMELLATIQKGETVQPRKEFAIVDPSPQFVLAFFSRELKKEEQDLLSGAGIDLQTLMPAGFSQGNGSFENSLVFSLSMRGGLDLNLTGKFGSADIASQFKKGLESAFDQMKMSLTLFKGKISKPLAEFAELAISNFRIEDQNPIVKMSIQIPESAQETLRNLPPALMELAGGMSMINQFSGGSPASQGMDAVGAMKQPGETDPVSPASVEGLPDGLTITAKSAWSFAPATLPDATSSVTMEVLVDVAGDGLEKVCGATGMASKTAKLDSGTKLRVSKFTPSSGIDLQKTFLPYDVSDEMQTSNPPKTLRVRLMTDAPSSSATKIDVLEGSFKILTAESSQEFTIEDAVKRASRPLTGPEFKSAELKLRRSHSDITPQTLTLSCGKDHFLGQVKGTPEPFLSFTEVDKDQTVQRMYPANGEEKLPEDLQISFKLYSKTEEHVVSFRFENITLPDKNLKPKLQAQPE